MRKSKREAQWLQTWPRECVMNMGFSGALLQCGKLGGGVLAEVKCESSSGPIPGVRNCPPPIMTTGLLVMKTSE